MRRSEDSRTRSFPPLTLLAGLLVALTVLLVEAAILLAPPGHPPFIKVLQLAATAIVSTAIIAAAVYWFVGAPLRSVLHVIYRMTEGDFEIRTDVRDTGMIARILQALNDMAGILEARWAVTRASERRYRLLYEHSPAGLFRTREDGRVIECNMAAVEMLGYDSIVEVKTHNARTYYANARDRDRVLERLRRDGAIRNLQLRFLRKDGREFPVLLSAIRTEETGETFLEGQVIDLSGINGYASLDDEAPARELHFRAAASLGDGR